MTRRSHLRRPAVAGLATLLLAALLTAVGHPHRPATAALPTHAEPVPGTGFQAGFQGSVSTLPTSLDFAYDQGAAFGTTLQRGDGQLAPSPSTTGIAFQREDVSVGDAPGATITWVGRVDPARSVTLRAWNGTAWESLASGRGLLDGDLTLTGHVAAPYVRDGVVPVMVTGQDPFADDLANPVRPSFEAAADYDIALAHVSDTQYLAEGAISGRSRAERRLWRRAYASSMRWIAEHAADRKIAFAAHTGDLVQNWQLPRHSRRQAAAEFRVSSAAQRILDRAGVVNSVLPGNHDNRSGAESGRGALFNRYFGPRRYAALAGTPSWRAAQATYRPWRPGDNANNYVLFTAGGLDFVALSLGFHVTDAEAAWAERVLDRYAERNAIVLTHAYTAASRRADGRGGGLSYDGQRVSSRVVARHPNVFLVLSGHEHGVNIEVRRDVGRAGNHVVELLADYQFYEVPAGQVGLGRRLGGRTPLRLGASFLRLLQIDVDRSEMRVDTYSPLLADFGASEYDDRRRYDGTEDDFALPLQLQTRTTSFATDSLDVVPDLRPRDR